MMACGYLGLCFGDNRADPIAKLNGETYVVEMKKKGGFGSGFEA